MEWYILIILIIFLILLYLLIEYQDLIKMTILSFFIIKRGILRPNKFWWTVQDYFIKDVNGNNLYKSFKDPITKVNFWGIIDMHLVKDIGVVKYILNNSPCLFKAGYPKYKFFKSFMDKNIGISECPEWFWRRKFNEGTINNHLINKNLLTKLPCNFDDFMSDAKRIAKLIVFSNTGIGDDLFEIFDDANTVVSLFSNYKVSNKKLLQYITMARPGSMVYDLMNSKELRSYEEFVDQVPHWIFPIVGTISQTAPRLLCILYNHPNILEEVKNKKIKLRHCILELLRLNSPVITVFRESTEDIIICGKEYPKGTQFIILNNPIMRDEKYFQDPNKYKPERWGKINENDYISLMFGQGPQKCPGKELAINLLIEYVGNIIKYPFKLQPSIDTDNIPQMINPYEIRIDYIIN